MGQADILKLLKEKDRPMSTKEMAEILGQSQSTVSSSLSKLVKQFEIKRDGSDNNWLVPVYSIIKEVNDEN